MSHDLAVEDGDPQRLLAVETATRTRVQGGHVELDTVPPVLLGLVLGQICLAEQVLWAVQGRLPQRWL